MTSQWTELDYDQASGRRIFKRDAPSPRAGNYGTHDFSVAADFEVRDSGGAVLLSKSETACGEYWCGVFLWFVKDTDGRQVRLEASNKDEQVFDVPSTPKSPAAVRT